MTPMARYHTYVAKTADGRALKAKVALALITDLNDKNIISADEFHATMNRVLMDEVLKLEIPNARL